MQDTSGAHGSPLGDDEIRATKEAAGWPVEPTFHIPEEVHAGFRELSAQGMALRTAWEERFDAWRKSDHERAALWDAIQESRTIPNDLTRRLLDSAPTSDGATRAQSGAVIQKAAELVPALIGGSADLEPSNKTWIKESPAIARGEFAGRNFHFGIREHGMGAVVNGILYHGGFRPFGATFLVFSDYMRPSIRLSALAGLPAVWVFTHDSIFVGEDGPTHQPVEHAAALRVIPNLDVFRPADGFETALAWGSALERTDGPTAIVLTRQKLPPIERRVSTGELTGDPTARRLSRRGRR